MHLNSSQIFKVTLKNDSTLISNQFRNPQLDLSRGNFFLITLSNFGGFRCEYASDALDVQLLNVLLYFSTDYSIHSFIIIPNWPDF